MGKIRNGLVSLVVGTGLVFGAGAVNVARGGGLYPAGANPIGDRIIYGELEKDVDYTLEWRKNHNPDGTTIGAPTNNQTQQQNKQQNNKGNLEKNVGDGLGTKDYGEGIVYVGEMKNGEPDGQGTLYVKGKIRYVGGWKIGIRNGEGILFTNKSKNKKVLYDMGSIIEN